jgi:hypothetical protein
MSQIPSTLANNHKQQAEKLAAATLKQLLQSLSLPLLDSCKIKFHVSRLPTCLYPFYGLWYRLCPCSSPVY